MRQEQEKFMSPMEIRMSRMKNGVNDDFKGGRRTRRKRNNSRKYKQILERKSQLYIMVYIIGKIKKSKKIIYVFVFIPLCPQ